MDHPITADSASRFEAYVEALVSVIGHADRARPLRDYCVGLMLPCERKSVEPMGCGDGAGAHRGATSVAAAFCWQWEVVGREGPGQGARVGAAEDRAARSDRSVDHRRHRLSQEGAPFG